MFDTMKKFFGYKESKKPTYDKILQVSTVNTGSTLPVYPPFNPYIALELYNGWIYIAINLKANAVASTPLRLYQHMKSDGKKTLKGNFQTKIVPDWQKKHLLYDTDVKTGPSSIVRKSIEQHSGDFEEVIEDHPIMVPLRGNQHWTSFDLMTFWVQFLELTGSSFFGVLRDKEKTGLPIALWPLSTQYMTVIPSKETFIEGYRYEVNGKREDFKPDEILHCKYPNPRNQYYGLSKLEGVYSAALLYKAKRDSDTTFYQNYQRPDFITIVKPGVPKDEIRHFEMDLQAKLAGPRGSGKQLTITGDIEVVPLQRTEKNDGTNQSILEEIAAGFDVPISKLQSNDANYSNGATADLGFYRDGISPILRIIEQFLNEQYLSLFGDLKNDYFLAFDDILINIERDRTIEKLVKLTGGKQVLTVDEARAELGYKGVGKNTIDDNSKVSQDVIEGNEASENSLTNETPEGR